MDSSDSLGEFRYWLDSPAGRQLVEMETQVLCDLVPNRYYAVTAQLSAPEFRVIDQVNTGRRIQLIGVGGGHRNGAVVADFHSLPFGHHMVDLAILPHTLDFVSRPHDLLRELTQSLTPDGYLVLSGFHPYSMWGLGKWMRLRRDAAPWCGHFFSVGRIQDWLLLMGYGLRAGKMMMYRPPVRHEGLYNRLALLEKAGDRWWPMFGAVYIIVAQLETLRMIPFGSPGKRVSLKPDLVSLSRKNGMPNGERIGE